MMAFVVVVTAKNVGCTNPSSLRSRDIMNSFLQTNRDIDWILTSLTFMSADGIIDETSISRSQSRTSSEIIP